MDQNEQFFVTESITHLRTLPLPDCIRFLDGLLSAIGEDHPAWHSLTAIKTALHVSDAQLDLISIGQLKLNLWTAPRQRKSAGGK